MAPLTVGLVAAVATCAHGYLSRALRAKGGGSVLEAHLRGVAAVLVEEDDLVGLLPTTPTSTATPTTPTALEPGAGDQVLVLRGDGLAVLGGHEVAAQVLAVDVDLALGHALEGGVQRMVGVGLVEGGGRAP